jgi:hypothetical protein
MAVPKINLWNHLLNDIQQIFFRSLPHLTSRQTRRRMRHEQTAQTFRYLAFRDQRIDAVGEVDNLLQSIGLYLQPLHSPL